MADFAQQGPNCHDDGKASRRRHQLRARAHKERIGQSLPQSGKRVADRRWRDEEAGGGALEVALLVEHQQGLEKIQIKAMQVHCGLELRSLHDEEASFDPAGTTGYPGGVCGGAYMPSHPAFLSSRWIACFMAFCLFQPLLAAAQTRRDRSAPLR